MKSIQKIQLYLLIISCCLLIFILPAKGQNNIDITLTWSSNTYVPAEYQGKALPTRNSQIEVVAVIDNPKDINPQELIYEWSLSRNFHLQEKIIEQGKQTLAFTVGESVFYTYSIDLRIIDEQNNVLAEAAPLTINLLEPQIVFHSIAISNGAEKKLPAIDTSNLNLKKYQTRANLPLKITAKPYFFNMENIDGINYDWIFGNQRPVQENGENDNILTLKIGEIAGAVVQDLNLSVQNKNDPVQRAQTNAKIILTP